MQANFLLGQLKITPAAKKRLKRVPFDLLAMHALNEHGHLSKREARRNEIAMTTIGEITEAKGPRSGPA